MENGDLILQYLERLGIDYVFGITGGSIEPLYNALARSERRGGPKAVLARHEAGAAFMADGYARVTGKIGVCCSTSGPGATNLLTGVANAYADGIPMLVITAQPSIERFGLGAFQEGSCTGINTLSMFDSCTRYNTLVSHPAQLEHKLVQAISFAMSRHAGPVHLSIPMDIMRAKAPGDGEQRAMRAFLNHETFPSTDGQHLMLKKLAQVKRATIVIGTGCADAIDEILAFAEERQWPIVTTPMAKGYMPSYHPLYRGVFGLGGHESARRALLKENAEKVLVIGSALDEVTTAGWDEEALFSERLIHISDNSEHLSRSIMSQLSILGDPKGVMRPFLQMRDEIYVKKPRPEQVAYRGFPEKISFANKHMCLDEGSPVKPQSLFWKLSTLVPSGTRALMDTGNSFLWGVHYWQVKDESHYSKNLFHVGMGFATMGWAIGAAVGMAFAEPKVPIICFTGDGSVLMSGQEMTVALEHKLNILFVILNDSELGMIQHGQRMGGAESIGHSLPSVNFKMMVESYGCPAHRISSMDDIYKLNLSELMTQPGPCVLDVLVDATQEPPMRTRMKVITEGVGNEQ